MTVDGSALTRSWSDDLVAEMRRGARSEGPQAGAWPGLTFYRYTEPTQTYWPDSTPLSICVIAHGAGGDDVTCLVLGNDRDCEPMRLDASFDQPCLCFLLEVDPQLISEVSASMLECTVSQHADDGCVLTTLDDVLMGSIIRFLRSLCAASDRRILTPLYLQELVYRVLQRGQFARLVRIAAQQMSAAPMATTLDYIDAHLADPLTVTRLARQANLSQSAFSRAFKQATGRSPYQFVKEKRLTRARVLLDEARLSVTEVSHDVGYLSLSHFIKEFRNQYGTTPGEYLDARTSRRTLRTSSPIEPRPRAWIPARQSEDQIPV
ncbi:AraC family transcriptional regulator [Mycobacterium sp. EPG1]|nr:AraC family transcriptional regulator [Mycobacterium sp. EPG1]